MAPLGPTPKVEGALLFDEAVPLDDEVSVDEAPVEDALAPEELEEPLDDKLLEAAAESRALAPTLVSVALYVLTEVLSVGPT